MINVTARLLNLFEQEQVLRIDENGANIVWENGPYSITVSDPTNVTFLTLRHERKAVGWMWLANGKETATRGYKLVEKVEILPAHRGKDLGQELYRQALRFLAPKWKGLASEDNQRENQKQVPHIWRKLGAREIDGHFVLDR